MKVAKSLGLNVIGSSPLLQGALIQVPLSSQHFKCSSLGAKHLNFLRSVPCESIKSILIGQKTHRHVKQNLEVMMHEPLTTEEFLLALEPNVRKEEKEPNIGE